jgi:hypothetical protein
MRQGQTWAAEFGMAVQTPLGPAKGVFMVMFRFRVGWPPPVLVLEP